MGLFDSVVNSMKESHEKSKLLEQKHAECDKDLSIYLNFISGNKELGLYKYATLRQKNDGTVYFNYNDDVLYRLVGYEWNGPIYEQIITTNSQGNYSSETVKKGKSGKMAAGALIGTALMPGVGTVVGAAIGAGGKSKSNSNAHVASNAQQVNKQIEQQGNAIIHLHNISDNSFHSLTFVCDSSIDSKMRFFHVDQAKTTSEMTKDITDSLKGIKALKELLDMGAITQEEFDTKKQQLLNS